MRSHFPTHCTELSNPDETLRCAQEQFAAFQRLLDRNNQVLKVIGDMEEKSLGEYLFDLNYVRNSLRAVREGVCEIIEQVILLGGDAYEPLRERYEVIDRAIARLLPGSRPIPETPFVIGFGQLRAADALSVGSKNAQLGELHRLGIPVPDGFAISAWAYKRFLDSSGLGDRIRRCLEVVDIGSYAALARMTDHVRSLVLSAPVPSDLVDAIEQGLAALQNSAPGVRLAVRSSGIGEDSFFSFAGQYATFLNVAPRDVVDVYRKVIASKFTPQAVYYFLSHALTEAELAMSVGCVPMVDAAAAGVVYTRDPLRADLDELLIHAVLGLGEALVDGSLSPDVFRISRTDLSLRQAVIVEKPTWLVMDPQGGTRVEPAPLQRRASPSVDEATVRRLAEYALRVEQHYGAPQDIEWAVDRDGRVFLLQTRPLRVLPSPRPSSPPTHPTQMRTSHVLIEGGTTACPGAGAGPVVQVLTSQDLGNVPQGAVVVAPNPFPGLITVMGKAQALVTEVGGVASHMATLAREYRVPTLVGVFGATSLQAGSEVTVDATGSRILRGVDAELVETRRRQAAHSFEDLPLFQGFRAILALIAPLNLLHPSDPGFTPANCKTLHDITRFAHQCAMSELFVRVAELESRTALGLRLASPLPLPVVVLYIDRPMDCLEHNGCIRADQVDCAPFRALWDGMAQQGWPSGPSREGSGFESVLATHDGERTTDGYAIKSFAVVARNYMMLSLHLGYHFTTIEAMAADEANKNYIRLQYKDGGASLQRRVRRIRLVASLLERLGFENASQADFLDASVCYQDAREITRKLLVVGRIVLMTKQLDMALSNDRITDWYTRDFAKRLGLDTAGAS